MVALFGNFLELFLWVLSLTNVALFCVVLFAQFFAKSQLTEFFPRLCQFGNIRILWILDLSFLHNILKNSQGKFVFSSLLWPDFVLFLNLNRRFGSQECKLSFDLHVLRRISFQSLKRGVYFVNFILNIFRRRILYKNISGL